MHALVTCLLLVASLVAQAAPMLLANYASVPQEGWVFVGLPDTPKDAAGWAQVNTSYSPWVREDGGLRIYVSLAAGERAKAFLTDKPRDPEPFAWHSAISSDLTRIAPTWRLGGDDGVPSVPQLVRSSPASQTWLLRSRWPARRVTIDCWATACSGTHTIEWDLHAIYGDTQNDGQPQLVDLPALTMRSAGRIVVDFSRRNGTPAPTWDGEAWAVTLVGSRRWHRAARWPASGAILPLPAAARLEERPLVGMSLGWADRWQVFGVIPQMTPDIPSVRAGQRAAWASPIAGDILQTRPRTQPRESGTTGEQADFGWASDLAVVTTEPWEILDGIWQAQMYALRPTSNREPDGSPMQPALHNRARTYNQRPDLELGLADRLGWPPPREMAYIPSGGTWPISTSDDQHRCDWLLHAMVALTRRPSLEAIVHDHIALDATDYYLREGVAPSARSIGRLGITRASQVRLGFTAATANLRAGLDVALASPLWTAARPVRILGPIEEAKYGWTWAGTTAVIYGPQWWQQAIALGALRGAAAVLGDAAYKAASADLAAIITTNAWQVRNGSLLHAYAVRWDDGAAWPAEAWPTTFRPDGEGNTDSVYVSGAANYWTASAAVLTTGPNEVLRLLGPPRNVAQARWRAIR